MYAIYALKDPRDNAIFYIGYTEDVYRRFLEHIQCAGGNFAKNMRVMELRKANQMVIMETLELVKSRDLAELREGYWIRHFTQLGIHLVNVNKNPINPDCSSTPAIVLTEFSYEQAQAAWNAGNRSSRKLAKALSTSGYEVKKDRAWVIIRELKAKNLIE